MNEVEKTKNGSRYTCKHTLNDYYDDNFSDWTETSAPRFTCHRSVIFAFIFRKHPIAETNFIESILCSSLSLFSRAYLSLTDRQRINFVFHSTGRKFNEFFCCFFNSINFNKPEDNFYIAFWFLSKFCNFVKEKKKLEQVNCIQHYARQHYAVPFFCCSIKSFMADVDLKA